jgi:hypothetical protein
MRARSKSYRIFLLGFLALLIIILSPPGSKAQPSADTYHEMRQLIADIKKAVSDKNFALALEILSKADELLNKLEKRSLLDEEAIKWDLAQINLDRADSMENRDQIAFFATESIKRWIQYIEWYNDLSEGERTIISERPDSFRIQRAVRQLGNAIMRRDNIPPYSMRYLFEAYLELPAEYLSSQSVTLWRNWLFRCPTWNDPPEYSLRNLRQKFLSGKNACREDWVDFLGFLKEWLETQSLSTSKKEQYSRWVKDLNYALGNEENENENP